jgi:NADPH:quinone reductase-like Zn-dependent oxidoreductase
MAASMRGAVFYEHGNRDVLRYVEDLPIPEPSLGEVRVRIHAAALNRLDLFVRAGWKGLELHFPHVTGSDGAGVVDEVGTGGFASGDRVCIDPSIVPPDSPMLYSGLENQERIAILGEHRSGSAAEYIVLPARNLLKMPDHISFAEAAAAGLVYVTAWHSLITRGNLRPGETVLIVGAGGGVNTASIQIAKLAGAKVYVVGSNGKKCRKAEELGADVTINREEQPDWSKAIYQLTQKRGVDVVVDNVGQATMISSIRSVRIGGRILIVGATSGPTFDMDIRYLFSKHISLIGSTMGPHVDYVKVMNLIFDGQLKPVIGEHVSLRDASEGHRLLEEGELFGKVLIELP